MQIPLRDRTQPLAQMVYQGLLQDIAARRRLAGERLVEAEIARALDVSRTPVREALNRLENDGLIESVKPTGYVVTCPSMDDVRDIFEIRRALEPVAFATVVRDGTPDLDADLARRQDAIEQANTPAASAQANGAFRAFWLDRIRNQRLRDTLLRFHMQVHLVRAATLHSEAGRTAAKAGTRRLAQAYYDRDEIAAHAAMQDFVDAALSFFEQAEAEGVLQTHPAPERRGQ